MSISCPSCESKQIVKNGKIHNGKQNYRCRDCGRQFVENRQQKIISQSTKNLIDKLLLEKIPLAGITRVTGVSEPWLQNHVNAKDKAVPKKIRIQGKKKGRLTIQCDEMWSFVGNKSNKQWIWLALDVKTREIVGVHVGDRRIEGEIQLWRALPAVYRQCAVSYSDFWEAYQQVFPCKRHHAVGKETGKTNYT